MTTLGGQIWPVEPAVLKLIPTFQNNWVNQDPSNKSPLQIHVDGNLVIVDGALSKATAVGSQTLISIFPIEARPTKIISTGSFEITHVGAIRVGRFQLLPTGEFTLSGAFDATRAVTQLYVNFSYYKNNA
jgi:hypothetical protein